MRLVAIVVALAAGVHAGLWALGQTSLDAPEIRHPLNSLSFAPLGSGPGADRGEKVTAENIRTDLKAIAPYTQGVRTYSATSGLDQVPAIANEFRLNVTMGAWIDRNEDRNKRELRAVVDAAKRNSNVKSIVVGNETIFRGEKTVPELIKLIHQVKRETQLPVTTGEIWHVWIEHPELASAVDYIAAHILPYWEGFSADDAVDQAMLIYAKLRDAFPGKRIVIAEFGWPSAGYNLKNGYPDRAIQAQVVRDFAARADKLGIEYNIVEAIDQPWKIFEGSVGPYWGMFDANRNPKFSLTGPISDPDYWKEAALAVIVGLLLSLPVLALAGATVGQAALLTTAANVVGAWTAIIVAYWQGHYFVWGSAFALVLGLILLIPLVLIALSRIDDIAAVAFGRKPRRLLAAIAPPLVPEGYAPKVSIHIPAYREPPDMLKQTLDAVSRLEYPNWECVVVINNTPDPAYWEPVEAHCRALGGRFKFVNAPSLAGFKAGALRLALEHTAPDAEIIGVIDADYAVEPRWLAELVPSFADAQVGLVQAPQDHRDGRRSLMHHAMNAEYAGFFEIGMVERNEDNAIIVHGTMCLVRRAALEAAGGWSSDTIVEDSDLGLTLLELGWHAHYTNRRYGYGLLPDTYEAFKKQRHRWAYGGVQLVRKHWRKFLPGGSKLTNEQRWQFVIGWLNWLGAESIGVAVAILNLVWVPIVAFAGIAIPDRILTVPIIAAFAVSLLHFGALYRLRVSAPLGQRFAAMLAAMSVQWTVAKAVTDGVIRDHLPFNRTAKGGGVKKGSRFPARWEAVLGALLLIGAGVVVYTNEAQVREVNIFAAVLVIQSVPFLSAALIAALEGTRFNDFAYWETVAARMPRLLTRRRAIAKLQPQPEKQPETAQ